MKKCKRCGKTLAFEHFDRSLGARDGHASRCKACKLLPPEFVFKPPKAKPAVVQASTVSKMAGNFCGTDFGYVRNNGNKHIPSRGHRC